MNTDIKYDSLPSVSVVIVDYNKAKRVCTQVETLSSQYPSGRINVVVVDNSCSKENKETLMHGVKGFNVELIFEDENTGYTKACNKGADIFKSDFLVLSNPDILWLQEKTLLSLIRFMQEHEDVAICGPSQVNDDGSCPEVVRRFPSPFRLLLRRTFLSKFFNDADLQTVSRNVDWLQSSCVVIRRDFWERVGGLDERYRLFMSDPDICLKAWLQGKKVYFWADCNVVADGRRASAGGIGSIFHNRVLRCHLRDAFLFYLYNFLSLIKVNFVKGRC